METIDSAPTVGEFLNLLFDTIPDDMCFYLWKLSSRSSFWYTRNEINKAASFADRQTNFYVGVSLLSKDIAYGKGERRRVTNKDSSGIVALYSDIDFGTEGHKKEGNPPTERDAMYVLEKIQIEPSVVVHSGNGLQSWWLLDKPWMFYDDDVRQEALGVSERWNKMVFTVASEQGWNVDSTFDLARVLRVPDTFNFKPRSSIKPVKVVKLTGIRYSIDDILKVIGSVEPKNKPVATPTKPRIVVDSGGKPNGKKLMLLMDYDAKFHQSYYRRRVDLKDTSNSGYDMSLASIAAKAGWDDQEIVDLIVSSRRDTESPVEDRVSYYTRTIDKVRSGKIAPEDPEETKIESVAEKTESEQVPRDEALELISQQLGVNISRIVRYVSNPPYRYSITTVEYGSIDLQSVESLIVHSKLRSSLADLGTLIPTFRGDKWQKLAKLILSSIENEDAGETDQENLQSWLSEYVLSNKPVEDAEAALKDRNPIKDDSGVWVSSDDFRRWLILNSMETNHTRKTLGSALRALGCERRTKAINMKNGSVARRSMWKLPKDMVGSHERVGTISDHD